MRAFADQHPVIVSALVSAVVYLVVATIVTKVAIPRLDEAARPTFTASAAAALVGAIILGIATFVVLRIVYS